MSSIDHLDYLIYKYLYRVEINVNDYNKFANSQLSFKTLIVLLFLAVMLSSINFLFRTRIMFFGVRLSNCYDSYQMNIVWSVYILHFIATLSNVIFILLIWFSSLKRMKRIVKCFYPRKFKWISDLWFILLMIDHSSILLSKTYFGSCEKYSCDPVGLYCNKAGGEKSLPLAITTVMIFVPPMIKTVTRSISCTVFFFCSFITIIIFAIGCSMLGWDKDLYTFYFLYVFISVFYDLEMIRQHLNLYLSTKNLNQEILRNKQLVSENRSTEIKCMITNVAYELKHVRN